MGGSDTLNLLHVVRIEYPLRWARKPASTVMYAQRKICDTLYRNLIGYGSIAGRNIIAYDPITTNATYANAMVPAERKSQRNQPSRSPRKLPCGSDQFMMAWPILSMTLLYASIVAAALRCLHVPRLVHSNYEQKMSNLQPGFMGVVTCHVSKGYYVATTPHIRWGRR